MTLSGLSVVIPCFNENESLVTALYTELSAQGAEVIVVDDGGNMELSFPHIHHIPNMGYGYAIKRGIENSTQDFILTMDGDGQHTFSDAQNLYQAFKLIDNCDMLIGQRYNIKETFLRRFGRKFLNFIAAIISTHYLSDLNSGMRIFRKDLAVSYRSILCDTFSYTTSLTMSMITDNYKVVNFPINVKPRTFGRSNVKIFKDGFVTLYYILWIGIALRTRGVRSWIRKNPTTRILLGIGLIILGIFVFPIMRFKWIRHFTGR